MGYFKKVGWATAIGLGVLGLVFIVLGLMSSLLRFGFLITGVCLIGGAIFCVVIGNFSGSMMGDDKLLANGVPGTAMVLSLQPTGTVINYQYHVCSIALRVQLAGQQPYDVTINQAVPVTAMPRVQPGAAIGVKVDLQDRSKAVIDWNLVVTPQAPMQQAYGYPQPGQQA